MIFSEAPGTVFQGGNVYTAAKNVGFSWVGDKDRVAIAVNGGVGGGHAVQTGEPGQFWIPPCKDVVSANYLSENNIMSGNYASRFAGDAFDRGYYWDSDANKFADVSDGYAFTLRPMFFSHVFRPTSSDPLVASFGFYNASTSKRMHYHSTLDDSSTFYLMPLFMTDKGLALPAYADRSKFQLAKASTATGYFTLNDQTMVVYSGGDVIGAVVLALSSGAGSLINTDDQYQGQISGYTPYSVSGVAVNDMSCMWAWDDLALVGGVLSEWPYAGKTTQELCKVTCLGRVY